MLHCYIWKILGDAYLAIYIVSFAEFYVLLLLTSHPSLLQKCDN